MAKLVQTVWMVIKSGKNCRYIKQSEMVYKHRIRAGVPKIYSYSQDLLNNIFRHPYTKIDFVVEDLGVTRLTATKYLDQLVQQGFLEKHKIGRSNYYVNTSLCDLFAHNPDVP